MIVLRRPRGGCRRRPCNRLHLRKSSCVMNTRSSPSSRLWWFLRKCDWQRTTSRAWAIHRVQYFLQLHPRMAPDRVEASAPELAAVWASAMDPELARVAAAESAAVCIRSAEEYPLRK